MLSKRNSSKIYLRLFVGFFYLLLFQFSEIQSLSNNDGNWNLCKKTEDDSISFSLSIFSVCFLPCSLNVVSALNDVGWASVSIANLKDIGKLNLTFPSVYFTPMESVHHRTVMETSVASSDKTVDGIFHFVRVGSGLILLFE